MKITLVDGSPSKYKNQNFAPDLAIELTNQGHHVHLIKVSEKKINYCNGCWSCWWKTPGLCVHKDDMPELYQNYMNSDLVLHFSPLEMGFVSSLLKTVNDRCVAQVHPYMAMVNGECHHQKRYEKYPLFGLIYDPANADAEDIQITKDLYDRMTLNFKTEMRVFTTNQKPMEELTDEINHI